MKSRSSVMLFLQALLVLAFSTFTANAGKSSLASWRALDQGMIDWSFQNTHGSKVNRALQFTGTDDSVKTAATDDATADAGSSGDDDYNDSSVFDGSYNSTSLLPPEADQPASWPATVLVLFVVLAAGLLVFKGVQNCKKRREYEDVPTNMIV